MGKTDKQNKSSMDESAELAQALMHCAGTGIYIVQGGRFQYVNSLFQELTGYTEQELRGVYSLDLVHPEDREAVRKKAIENLKDRCLLPYEYRFIKKNGEVMWVLERLASTEYRGKRTAVGSFMDITEHRRVEEALADEATRRRILLDQSRDGISVLDENGKVYEVNQRFAEMLGYSPEEVRELHVWDWDTQWTREQLLEMVRTVDEAGDHFETYHRRKDGTVFDVEISTNGAVVAGQKLVFCVSRDITERKRAEESLRRSEQNFHDSMENSPLGIRVLDKDGKTLYANRALLDMWGYSSIEALEAVPRKQRYTPQSYAEHTERVEKRRRGEYAPLSYEVSIVRSDGEVRILSASRGELAWNGEKRFQIVYQDITEHKQLEEALAKSEERYRTVLEQMEESYYEVDIAGNFTFFNDAMCRQLGYSREELMGMSYRAITPPENVKEVFGTYNQVYRTGEPFKLFPMERIRKDGTRLFIETSVFPLRNERGEIIGFRGIARDVTERKQMEEALRRSEERYRTILAEIEEGYYEVDLAGNFTFVNNATCRQLGYSKEELIGMNYRVYVLKEDVKSVYKAWNKVYRTGKPLKSYPFPSIKKDGTQIFLESSVSPLRNNEGKIIGFRSISRDVTEHKQFEQKLAEMATHDPLTGLPNRILLSDRFTMALALSRRSGNGLAVLMLDLDRFKNVNDSMGHDVGDKLLKAVGKRLEVTMRKSDTVARIGGDEFILVLPQIPKADEAVKFAQRILDAFREPFIFDDHQIDITTSIGIAVYPEDGKDIESLLKNADTAMYRAKEQGRNVYRFYDGEETGTLLME